MYYGLTEKAKYGSASFTLSATSMDWPCYIFYILENNSCTTNIAPYDQWFNPLVDTDNKWQLGT